MIRYLSNGIVKRKVNMWFIFLCGLPVILLAVAADYITWRLLKEYCPRMSGVLIIGSVCSLIYFLLFLSVYAFYLVDYFRLKWGFFIFLLLYTPRILFLGYWLIAILPLRRDRPVRKVSFYSGLMIRLVVFLLILHGGLIGRTKIIVQEVNIHSENLPESFNGFRIAQFSDLHLGSFENEPGFIARVVQTINSLDPDLVVFTGDIVNDKSKELEPFEDILSGIESRYGVYSALGNHDYGDYILLATDEEKQENYEEIKRIQKDMGWILLNNENGMIHHGQDSIAMVGVGNWAEPPYIQYGNLKKATEGLTAGLFTILLSHNPVHWRKEVLPGTQIDLTLSGHTHAMQVRFGNISIAALRYRDWGGLYQEKSQYLYVNQGIGFVFFPLRIGAYPEITLITLEKNPM